MSDVENVISGNNYEKPFKNQQQQQATGGPATEGNNTTTTAITRIANANLSSATATTTTTTTTTTKTDSSRSFQSSATKLDQFLSLTLKVVFSTPGLICLVIAYSLLGALLFPMLEAPQDINRLDMITKSREDCLRELWIITEKLNVLYERNWTMLVHEQLRRFEGTIVAATRHSSANAIGQTTTSHGNVNPLTALANGHHNNVKGTTQVGYFGGSFGGGGVGNYDGYFGDGHWTFSEALLYSVTVITTIGHGNLTPKTAAGKIATILYALIGVPLMLMCLSSLGALLAEALQCTYTRLCCRFEEHANESGSKSRSNKCSHKPLHGRQTVCNSSNSKDIDDDDVVAFMETTTNTETAFGFEAHQQQSAAGGQTNAVDGNNSANKYDALTNENNQNNANIGYDYAAGHYKGTMGHGEECCQLLHSSPVKMNHQRGSMGAVACNMQMKTMGSPAGQYYQRASTLQQPAKRNNDIMLMATLGHIKSNAFVCGTRSATTSPQHQQQAPSQTFQLLAAAPNNATPSHLQQQQSLPQQHGHHMLQPQKQFVAVPSGILRLTTGIEPTSTSASSTTSCSVTSTFMPVSQATTTTIYLPIIATGSAATQVPTNGCSTAAGQQQFYYNQPLVKYHTVHLPPPLPQQPQQKKSNLIDIEQTLTGDELVQPEAVDEHGQPLPPPPIAYQTATVHGIRRAKFLAKPLPQEINTIFAENDIKYRQQQQQQQHNHDLAHSYTNGATSATATAAAGSTGTASVSFSPNTITTTFATDDAVNAGAIASTITTTTVPADAEEDEGVNNASNVAEHADINRNALDVVCGSSSNANTTVDIMEDEEENEQQRLGSCTHGTPSRVPLIAQTPPQPGQQQRDYAEKSTRGLLNATAASFHRHTLHSFQRGSSRHQQQQRNCQMHCQKTQTLNRHKTGTTTIAIGQDTSDDDCDGYDAANKKTRSTSHSCAGSEEFMLERLGSSKKQRRHHASMDAENTVLDDLDNDDEDTTSCQLSASGPQVPISLVLLILLCYICLGTIIFALWENWSLIDGAYFCFVTLTTIGYGDFIPTRTFNGPDVQLFACCAYLILGLVLVAMFLSILETQLMWKCRRIAVRLKLATD